MKRIAPAIALIIAPPAAAETVPAAAPAPAVPAVSAMIGPALNVNDLATELKFYVDGLGMKRIGERVSPKHHETFVATAADPGRPALLLMSAGTAESWPKLVQGTAFDRMVMRVKDLPGLVARLKSLDYQVTDVHGSPPAYMVAVAHDPEGYEIELVETAGK